MGILGRAISIGTRVQPITRVVQTGIGAYKTTRYIEGTILGGRPTNWLGNQGFKTFGGASRTTIKIVDRFPNFIKNIK